MKWTSEDNCREERSISLDSRSMGKRGSGEGIACTGSEREGNMIAREGRGERSRRSGGTGSIRLRGSTYTAYWRATDGDGKLRQHS
jgi:hypothetical protein